MTTAPGVDALAGRYTLRPGTAQPIRGGRPVIAAQLLQRLAQGKSADLLPALLGSVFTLCGHAHRIAAGSAVRAALGDVKPLGQALRERLHAETAREHLQRMALDWPRHLAGQAPAPQWLRGCPVLTHAQAPAAGLDALAAWLQARWLDEAPATWLARLRDEGPTALRRWAQGHAGRHPVARLLHDCADRGSRLATEARPWRPWDDPAGPAAAMAQLAARLQEDGYVQRPHWQGQAAESGPWTRQARPATAHNAWMRLASRVQDLVQLALDAPRPEATPLAHGALACGPGEGIAWVEMARGLLVHWVKLDGRQRVVDLRVLAPTEWNLHPQGVLAGALAALPAGDPDTPAQARLLATAFDPCVEVDIPAAEPCHA